MELVSESKPSQLKHELSRALGTRDERVAKKTAAAAVVWAEEIVQRGLAFQKNGPKATLFPSVRKSSKSFNLPTLSGDSVQIFFRVGRWARIPDFKPVFRDIIGLATVWTQPNAFIHLIEWRLPIALTRHQFLVGMDSHEEMSAELAEVILANCTLRNWRTLAR